LRSDCPPPFIMHRNTDTFSFSLLVVVFFSFRDCMLSNCMEGPLSSAFLTTASFLFGSSQNQFSQGRHAAMPNKTLLSLGNINPPLSPFEHTLSVPTGPLPPPPDEAPGSFFPHYVPFLRKSRQAFFFPPPPVNPLFPGTHGLLFSRPNFFPLMLTFIVCFHLFPEPFQGKTPIVE